MENNNDVQLIKIEAVVREEMFVDVKKALTDIGVNGITAYQVVGCGIQRGMSEYVRGQKVDVQVLPEIRLLQGMKVNMNEKSLSLIHI